MYMDYAVCTVRLFESAERLFVHRVMCVFKLLQHYKSNKLTEVFVGRARVGPVIREEAANVTSQALKSTK